MQRVLLKFKSISAKSDILKNSLRLTINYDENNIQSAVEKVILADDNVDDFVSKLVKELRSSIKSKHTITSENPLDNFVTVVLDEDDVGEAEEKIANGIKKLRDKVRGFKSVKSADNYMNKFFDVSMLEVRL